MENGSHKVVITASVPRRETVSEDEQRRLQKK